uniref:C2 domain-containing protein n=1 Tax=Zonotrichia albicollis TaxID=44394 RepID=A0A8D2N1G4_ZONAL
SAASGARGVRAGPSDAVLCPQMAACVSRVELLAGASVHLVQVKSCVGEYGLVTHCQQLCSCVVLQLDHTKKIKNCQDPKFCKKLVVDYYFEKIQKLKFSVYDIANKSFDLNDDDYLGGIECALDQVRVVVLNDVQNSSKVGFTMKMK